MATRAGKGRRGGGGRRSGHAPQGSVVFETTETLMALAERDAGVDAYVDALAWNASETQALLLLAA